VLGVVYFCCGFEVEVVGVEFELVGVGEG